MAALPDGQEARLLTTEAESGRWARPADLLAEHDAGTLAMMPPTLAMLPDLHGAGTVAVGDGAAAADRAVDCPRCVSGPGEPLQVEVDGRIFALRRQGP